MKNPYTPVSQSNSGESTFREPETNPEPEATEFTNPTTGDVFCLIEEVGNPGSWVEAGGGGFVSLSDLQ